jgi:hypothetical protein
VARAARYVRKTAKTDRGIDFDSYVLGIRLRART